MSDGVTRLKELLFDSEAQALRALAQKIDNVAERDAAERDELRSLIEPIFERAGSTERLASSVSEILSVALRKAEVLEHRQLADSIAPVVVTTIKAELRNSRDEMVEALYPITGRLVKAYVASAIKDLTDQMNRRLEQNAVMLRLQSLATGKSVGELAMAGGVDFTLRDLYLIRRGTGELLAHWPEEAINGREQAMSGILAAINEFADDALAADHNSLRQIDLGSESLYLRGSATLLLAARCSGSPLASIERMIDEAFLDAIERYQRKDFAANGVAAVQSSSALDTIGRNLTTQIEDEVNELRRPVGGGILKALAALILLPIAVYTGYYFYGTYREQTVRQTAAATLAADATLTGYPVEFDVGARGLTLTVSGLSPSPESKAKLIQDLRLALPDTLVSDAVTAIPTIGPLPPDLKPDLNNLRTELSTLESTIAMKALQTAVVEAKQHTESAANDLSAAAVAVRTDERRASYADAETSTRNILADIASFQDDIGDPSATTDQTTLVRRLSDLIAAVRENGTKISELAGLTRQSATDRQTPTFARPVSELATELSGAAAQIARTASTVLLAAKLEPLPPPLPPPPVEVPVPVYQAPIPTPRDVLEAAARSTAIFFLTGVDYRDPVATDATLNKLADAIKAASVLVRIVGYTDEAGNQPLNTALSQQRADRVRIDLLARGVDERFVTAIGRPLRRDISTATGAGSPNRRVEFEVGFDGEAIP